MKPTGLITVRTNSTRLPRKCLFKFPERTVLEHNILRARNFGIRPIVCTTNEESDDEIIKVIKELDVEYFRGPSQNKMLRWLLCAEEYGLENFHTIDCDDPFLDYELIHRSLEELEKGNLDFVKPSLRSASGAATVGYSIKTAFLSLCLNGIPKDENTEMIETILGRLSKSNNKEIEEESSTQIRLTLDYLEDWVLIYFLESKFSFGSTRKDIDLYLINNPNLFRVNWFRNNEWKERQEEISNKIEERVNR
jgi:spore coat polysaccharide biosynthesis protein SpsF